MAAAELGALSPADALARIRRWIDDEWLGFADGYDAARRGTGGGAKLRCEDLRAAEVSKMVERGLVFFPPGGEVGGDAGGGGAEDGMEGARAGVQDGTVDVKMEGRGEGGSRGPREAGGGSAREATDTSANDSRPHADGSRAGADGEGGVEVPEAEDVSHAPAGSSSPRHGTELPLPRRTEGVLDPMGGSFGPGTGPVTAPDQGEGPASSSAQTQSQGVSGWAVLTTPTEKVEEE